MSPLVDTAAHIGDIARDDVTPNGCLAALQLLTDALGGEAATLDRATQGGHLAVASFGYHDRVARSFREEFVESPWFEMVLDAPVPPTISSEPGQTFRRGWFYDEYVAPYGHRDGVSCALHRDGSYAGMVHLSTSTSNLLGDSARAFVAGLAPLLANFTLAPEDPPGHRSQIEPVLADLARAAASVGLPGLQGILPSAAGWLRFTAHIGSNAARVRVVTEPTTVPYGLSPREIEVLTCIGLGMSNREIAAHLVVSERTVHSHVQHLLHKSDSTSRTHLAVFVVAERLMSPTIAMVQRHTTQVARAAAIWAD